VYLLVYSPYALSYAENIYIYITYFYNLTSYKLKSIYYLIKLSYVTKKRRIIYNIHLPN